MAPSNQAVNQPISVDMSGDSYMKYGEQKTTSNGWEVSIDTTDPVEEVTLANGWNVEVRYE